MATLTLSPPTSPVKTVHNFSPERINSLSRPSPFTTPTSITTSTNPSRSDSRAGDSNKVASPLLRKANLFADYQPKSSDPKASIFGPHLNSPNSNEFIPLRAHARTNSDVQGLVRRFEHLDVRDRDLESSERRKKHEAELRRAQIAREEAESDVKRLRAELRAMKKENDEGRERERLVSKRLDVVMEEFANSKDAHAAAIGVYDKEVRKARKEAFKSSSAVLKFQEELKSTRNSLRITQSGFELEKQKVQRKDQEVFEAQYQLVAVQQELDQCTANLKSIREENEALKTSLAEEEVARMAAEGMIALPPNDDDEDLGGSPQKSPERRPASPLSDDKENQLQLSPQKSMESRKLQVELMNEIARREQAEEMVEFMQLECMFRCCSCRAKTQEERSHQSFVPEGYEEIILQLRADVKSILAPLEADDVIMDEPIGDDLGSRLSSEHESSAHSCAVDNATTSIDREVHIDFSTGRRATNHSRKSSSRHQAMSREERLSTRSLLSPADGQYDTQATLHRTKAERVPSPSLQDDGIDESGGVQTMPLRSPSPTSPPGYKPTTPYRRQPSIKTVTTTTTIPMQFTPAPKAPSYPMHDRENIAPPPPELGDDMLVTTPIDREAALAAIQYRRGRARSIANGQITPRKQMLEGVSINERRDISAPVQGSKVVITSQVKSASAGRNPSRRIV